MIDLAVVFLKMNWKKAALFIASIILCVAVTLLIWSMWVWAGTSNCRTLCNPIDFRYYVNNSCYCNYKDSYVVPKDWK